MNTTKPKSKFDPLPSDLSKVKLDILLCRLALRTSLAHAKLGHACSVTSSLVCVLASGDLDKGTSEIRRIWRELSRRLGPFPVGT